MNRRSFLLGAVGAAACTRSGPRLNVYNWSDYVAPETIPGFEQETGIRVRYGTYESIPEMLAKVMSGNSGWDVVFPSAKNIFSRCARWVCSLPCVRSGCRIWIRWTPRFAIRLGIRICDGAFHICGA